MNSITIEDVEHEISEEVAEFIHLLARDKTRLENLLKTQTDGGATVPCSDGLDAPDGVMRFDCGGEIEMIDAGENTIRVKPVISVAGLKAGGHCNLILYKYQRGN